MYGRKLDEQIEKIKEMGDSLIPYNFPLGNVKNEDELLPLKTSELLVDGYNVIVHFSKADYEKHYLITVQIHGKYEPFLPFNLVTKLAKRFLGEENLYLVELLKDNRKIYCWTLTTTKDGEAVPNSLQEPVAEPLEYEGLRYGYLLPQDVNFF